MNYLYKYRTLLLCVISFFAPIVLVLTGADQAIGDFIADKWSQFAEQISEALG